MNFSKEADGNNLFYEKNSNTFFASAEDKCSYCLAFQCAPVLAGIKASNLLIIKEQLCSRAEKEISEAKTNHSLLYSSKMKYIYLIYREKELMSILGKPTVIAYLNKIGYKLGYGKKAELGSVLKRLGQRMNDAISGEKDFPHEIGIFMGYPIEDVLSFVENEGHNYALSGYWKVYHKKEVAQRLFRQYDLARSTAIKHIKSGGSLSQVKPLYSRAYKESLTGMKTDYCVLGA